MGSGKKYQIEKENIHEIYSGSETYAYVYPSR